jgi:hypothetical protein
MIELQFYLIPYFSAFQYERCRLKLVTRWTAFVRSLTLSCQRVQLAVGLAGSAVHHRPLQEAVRHGVLRRGRQARVQLAQDSSANSHNAQFLVSLVRGAPPSVVNGSSQLRLV